ncbi:MAG: PIG-L deacetylase family protein [Candidatus Omnitrophota bacterium]
MNSLIIAAHPDDEVLGCGGTIARLANEMKNVYVAILGEGITSRYSQRELADGSALKTLQNSSKRVSELLGVKELFLYNLPDNRFDTIPLLDIVKIIEALIDKVKPSTIYTHHGGDLNIDHSIIHRATLTATRPLAGQSVKQVYTYEVPSSTEWAFGKFAAGFQANVFVDISGTLEKKIEAMEVYESEARTFPHPRSPEALRALAKRWGVAVGLEAAEAFELIREIR